MEERKQVSELKQLLFWKWSYIGGNLVKFDIGKLITVQIFVIAVRILQSRAIRKLLSVLAENASLRLCLANLGETYHLEEKCYCITGMRR